MNLLYIVKIRGDSHVLLGGKKEVEEMVSWYRDFKYFYVTIERWGKYVDGDTDQLYWSYAHYLAQAQMLRVSDTGKVHKLDWLWFFSLRTRRVVPQTLGRTTLLACLDILLLALSFHTTPGVSLSISKLHENGSHLFPHLQSIQTTTSPKAEHYIKISPFPLAYL